MASTVPVQTRVEAGIKKRAEAVLDKMGLTVSDAVRILLTRIANEGALPTGLTTDAATHDAWFRAKLQGAIDDTRPAVPQAKVEAHFKTRRARALKAAKSQV